MFRLDEAILTHLNVKITVFWCGGENCRNKTCDITVGELKKCGKFETVLVSSSEWISEENHSKSKVNTLKFTLHPKLKRGWLLEMKRECFTPSEHSRVCAELFTEDNFEQSLTARSMLGRYFKPSRIAFQNDAVPTIFSFPMESCKPAIGQTNDEK